MRTGAAGATVAIILSELITWRAGCVRIYNIYVISVNSLDVARDRDSDRDRDRDREWDRDRERERKRKRMREREGEGKGEERERERKKELGCTHVYFITIIVFLHTHL